MDEREVHIKPFISYNKQIDYLIHDKGLVIQDRDYAIRLLENLSYYSLIDEYRVLFYEPMSRRFIKGTTLEDIVMLYQFDASLRSLIMECSNIIEQKLRSSVSYFFCCEYSNDQKQYLDPKHYINTRRSSRGSRKRDKVKGLINILNGIVNHDTEHDYIRKEREEYGNIPLYATVRAMTFGQTATMYSVLEPKIQSQVSADFNVTPVELMQYLMVLSRFRNKCAHIERVYCYKDRNDIPDTVIHAKMHIPKDGSQYVCGKHDLFSVVIAFRYLLPDKHDFLVFKRKLAFLINKTVRDSTGIPETVLLSSMGFPPNWKNISRYRI